LVVAADEPAGENEVICILTTTDPDVMERTIKLVTPTPAELAICLREVR